MTRTTGVGSDSVGDEVCDPPLVLVFAVLVFVVIVLVVVMECVTHHWCW